MGSQARVTQYQAIHFIRATLAYNSNGVSTGIVIGHMPAGARVTSVHTFVETAQNAGTTNTASLGYIAETNGILSAAVTAQTQLTNAQTTAAAGQFTSTITGTNGIITTDVALVASLAQSGTAATAGVVTFIVNYAPNL